MTIQQITTIANLLTDESYENGDILSWTNQAITKVNIEYNLLIPQTQLGKEIEVTEKIVVPPTTDKYYNDIISWNSKMKIIDDTFATQVLVPLISYYIKYNDEEIQEAEVTLNDYNTGISLFMSSYGDLIGFDYITSHISGFNKNKSRVYVPVDFNNIYKTKLSPSAHYLEELARKYKN